MQDTTYPFSHRDFRYLVEIRARLLADAINSINQYTPSVPGDWTPVPTTVSEALDILAAATPSGGGEQVINFIFDHTFVYPYVLQVVAAPLILNSVQIIITTPFNAGATLELGTATNQDLVFDTTDCDIQVLDTYGSGDLYPFAGADQLKLNISGATAGAGILVYKIR